MDLLSARKNSTSMGTVRLLTVVGVSSGVCVCVCPDMGMSRGVSWGMTSWVCPVGVCVCGCVCVCVCVCVSRGCIQGV